MFRAYHALYRCLIGLYPASFRSDFGEEMQAVFSEALASQKGAWQRAVFFSKEVCDLPGAVLRLRLADWSHIQGDAMNSQAKSADQSSRQEAVLGALPFLMYGLICMLVKFPLPFSEFFLWLGFYLVTVIWLAIGWVKRFPRWSYAYLGWSVIVALTWGGAPLVLLIPAILVALLWSRSLDPIKQFFLAIWKDWTCLSFVLITFPAWFVLTYDGNHHPYLMFFMLGSTLVLGLGAYLYLRSPSTSRRIASLLGSLAAAITFLWICNNIRSRTTYDLQPAITQPWYLILFSWFVTMAFVAILLFGPAILALFRSRKRQPNA